MGSTIRRCGEIVCIAAALACTRPLSGDGMMAPIKVGTSTAMVASPRQEAVMITDGETVQVILRTFFRRGPGELAWVIPVPAKPRNVTPGEEGLFTHLEKRTAPSFYAEQRPAVFGGCASSADTLSRGGRAGGVVVESAGQAGIYDYSTLSSDRAEDLVEWLDGHGYAVPPGAGHVFERYAAMGWHWLALKVRPEAAALPTIAAHPISYTYSDGRLIYPLVISRLSADEENEIVVYAVGFSAFACGNWVNLSIEHIAVRADPSAPSRTDYEKTFRRLTDHYQGHLFITEFSYTSEHFLIREGLEDPTVDKDLMKRLGPMTTFTRLRALVPKRAMDRDLVLVPVDEQQIFAEHPMFAMQDPPVAPPALALTFGLVAVAGLGTRMAGGPRRRRFGTAMLAAAGAFLFVL